MPRVSLGPDGPASFTINGFTVYKGAPRDDIPLSVAHAMRGASKHIVVRMDEEEARQPVEEVVQPKQMTRQTKMQHIIWAIDQLDIDNETHFTSKGAPDARALTSILKFQVTASDRDDAVAAAAKGMQGIAPEGAEGADAPDDETVVNEQPPVVPHPKSSNIKIVRKQAASSELMDTGSEAAKENEDDEDPDKQGGVTV